MKQLIILVLSLLFMSSVSAAQTTAKFDNWKKGAYWRGFNVVADETSKTQQDFLDLKATGATFVYIGTKGFRTVEVPYSSVDFNIQKLEEYISYCHTAHLPYALNIRQGPGRRDVYLESIGDPLSTVWTNASEQQQYASMLREIVEKYKNDTLFIGIAPMTEPDPLSKGYFYLDTSSLKKLLVTNKIDMQAIMQLNVDSIRSVSKDIPILIQGPAYAAPEFIPLTPKINDPFIVYEYHCYRPHEYVYAGDTISVVYPGNYISYIQLKIAWFDKIYLKDTVFRFIYDRQKETGAPIFMGEFGLQFPHSGGEQLLTDLSSSAIENGWHFAYWDWRRPAGEGWNYELMPGTFWNAVLRSFIGNSLVTPADSVNMDISLSPNPSVSNITIIIHGAGRVKKLSLYDVLGHELKQIPLQNNVTQLNIEDLPSGEYLVLLHGDAGVIQKKLLVSR